MTKIDGLEIVMTKHIKSEIDKELKKRFEELKPDIAKRYEELLNMRNMEDVKTGQSIEKVECSWMQEDDPEICYWKTRCGNSFYFTEGTPADNRMKYCCYCGKLLKQED